MGRLSRRARKKKELEGGVASVASKGPYSGFIKPHDIVNRRRFAEYHGLKWIAKG